MGILATWRWCRDRLERIEQSGTVTVAVVMGGTADSSGTWRVVKVLEELGHGVG
jgi:hypothetical protein